MVCFRRGVYRGWFPVVTSIYCSNFVYFYVFNGLKAIVYGPQSNPTAAKDLLLGLIAGILHCCHTLTVYIHFHLTKCSYLDVFSVVM